MRNVQADGAITKEVSEKGLGRSRVTSDTMLMILAEVEMALDSKPLT